MSNRTQDNVFAIYGHGREFLSKFEHRNKVPDGITIVVFTTCANPNFINYLCQFNEIFVNQRKRYDGASNTDLLKDPIKNKKKLEELFEVSIRIYKSGMLLPVMSTDLFIEYDSLDKSSQEKFIVKSGVYRINDMPIIDRNIMPDTAINGVGELCNKWSGKISNKDHYSLRIHNEIYKKNLFNHESIVEKNYSPSSSQRPRSSRKTSTSLAEEKYDKLCRNNFNILDIVNTIGKGVYYYQGCRSVGEITNINNSIIQRINIGSENQQLQHKKLLVIEKKITSLIDDISKNRDYLIEYNNKLFTKLNSLSDREKRIAPQGALYLFEDVFYHSFKIILQLEHSCIKILHKIIKCIEYLCKKSIEYYSYESTSLNKKFIANLAQKSMSDIVESINTILVLNREMFLNKSLLPEDKLKELFFPKKTQKALSPSLAAIIIPPPVPPRQTAPLTRRVRPTTFLRPMTRQTVPTRRVIPTTSLYPMTRQTVPTTRVSMRTFLLPSTRRTSPLTRRVSTISSSYKKDSYILDDSSIKDIIEDIRVFNETLNKMLDYSTTGIIRMMQNTLWLFHIYLELYITYVHALKQFYEEASEKVSSINRNPNTMHIYKNFLYFIKDKTAIDKIIVEYKRLVKLIKIFKKSYATIENYNYEIKKEILINPFTQRRVKPQLTETS